jgi:hypothetical protein
MQVARERETEPEWASDVIRYLRSGELPSHKEQSHKVRLQSARYTMVDDVLYRRGYSHPLLKCLSAPEAHYVLREIHEGVCGNHSGGRMLALKAVRVGCYWPTMTQDSMEFGRSCDKCQRFARVMKNPPRDSHRSYRLGRSPSGGWIWSDRCHAENEKIGSWW